MNKVSILNQNVQCVRNKIELIEATLHLNEIDVVCIQEHWLKNEEKNFININGFNLGAIYCRSDNKNGGVAIFYRQNTLTMWSRNLLILK